MSRTEVNNLIFICPAYIREILVKSQMPLYKGHGTSFAVIDRASMRIFLAERNDAMPDGIELDGPDRLIPWTRESLVRLLSHEICS